ncbi:MAG: hypothetical protein RL226_1076 [Bacteroidota bacterium]|jgi:hypothetical protein
MEGLVSLVKVLRPSEKRLLVHHYARNTNAEEKMRLKLFKLVDSGVSSDEEAKSLLNGKGGASSYSHLKSRLKNDILNILMMQDTDKRFAQPNRAAELDCRKKVAQSHILLLRGAQIEGMKVLTDALRAADRFELLAERLQINHLLREKFLGAGSSEQLNKLNRQINSDLSKYEALLVVEEKSFILASPEFAQKLKKRSNDKQNLQLIEELKTLYRKHKLARIGFWYYMAATEYHNARSNYDSVVDLGLEFLKLVEKSPAVKSKNNIAGVNQTVGVAFLELRGFDQARQHLMKAEKLFPVSGFNRLQCLQFLVQSESANEEYESALTHIQLALSHPRIAVRENLLPRWLYFKACVEFLNGDIDGSFKSLNKDGYLMKQVDDWNVQFRLLEIMQLISLKDEEWLEFRISTLSKFLTRHKDLAKPRVLVALSVFRNVLRKELNFAQLSDKNKESLRLCLAEEGAYKWNPTGPELVRFDKWVSAQLPIQSIKEEGE